MLASRHACFTASMRPTISRYWPRRPGRPEGSESLGARSPLSLLADFCRRRGDFHRMAASDILPGSLPSPFSFITTINTTFSPTCHARPARLRPRETVPPARRKLTAAFPSHHAAHRRTALKSLNFGRVYQHIARSIIRAAWQHRARSRPYRAGAAEARRHFARRARGRGFISRRTRGMPRAYAAAAHGTAISAAAATTTHFAARPSPILSADKRTPSDGEAAGTEPLRMPSASSAVGAKHMLERLAVFGGGDAMISVPPHFGRWRLESPSISVPPSHRRVPPVAMTPLFSAALFPFSCCAFSSFCGPSSRDIFRPRRWRHFEFLPQTAASLLFSAQCRKRFFSRLLMPRYHIIAQARRCISHSLHSHASRRRRASHAPRRTPISRDQGQHRPSKCSPHVGNSFCHVDEWPPRASAARSPLSSPARRAMTIFAGHIASSRRRP